MGPSPLGPSIRLLALKPLLGTPPLHPSGPLHQAAQDPMEQRPPITWGSALLDPLTGCTATASDSINVEPQPQGHLVIEGLSGCDVLATFSYTGTADSLIWDFGDPFSPASEVTNVNAVSHAYPNPLGTGYVTVASVTAISEGCSDYDALDLSVPALPMWLTSRSPTPSVWAKP